MSFVGLRQPTRVELKRVCDGGGLGEESSRRREDGSHDYWWRRRFLKDAYQEISPSIDSRRQTHTHTLRERERLWTYCFNWVAALGHRGGQEFGPLPLWPLTVTAFFFLCEATPLYFFVFYNFVLFYDLFVSIVGRGRSSSGQGGLSWWGNVLPQTYVLLKISSLALFDVVFMFIYYYLI